MFSPRFTFTGNEEEDGPATSISSPTAAAREKEANGINGGGDKKDLVMDHLTHLASAHFSDEDDDDDEEDEEEDEQREKELGAVIALTNPAPTVTQEQESEASATTDLTPPSPGAGSNQAPPVPTATLESESVALAAMPAPSFPAEPMSPGSCSNATNKAPSSPLRNRLMMPFSRTRCSSSSSSSSSPAVNPPPTPPPVRDSSASLYQELFASNNNLHAKESSNPTSITTTITTGPTAATASHPAPLASFFPMAFAQTRSSSSSSTGVSDELLLLSASTNSTTENTAANISSSRTATTFLSSLGHASISSSSKSELQLLRASSSSSSSSPPQVDLELCLGTITQLKDQLVHTNRTVEQLAAENVALQRELSSSRRTPTTTTTTTVPSAAAAAGNRAPSTGFASSFSNPGRRLLQRSSTALGSSSSSNSSSSSPLAMSLPAWRFTDGKSNPSSSSLREDVPLEAALSLQHSIDENTRTLTGFMELLSKTQKAMEGVNNNESAKGLSQTLSLSSNSVAAPAVAGQQSPPVMEAAMKEELQAAVAHMTALAQQFQATLQEHRGGNQAASSPRLAATTTSKKEESEAKAKEATALASPRKAELHTLSSRDALADVSMAGLQNEVLRLQQQLRLMTTHASKEERELVEEAKALRQEVGRLRGEVLEKAAEAEVYRQEVQQIKTSLRQTLEDRRRRSTELTRSHQASSTSTSTSVEEVVPSPPSTRVAAGAAAASVVAATVPSHRNEPMQQDKVLALKTQVVDLESMLRLQMQIKSKVVLELTAKRQEVHELQERLSMPPATDAASREVINYNAARRLKQPVDQRHQARAEREKEENDKLSEKQRQEQEERRRRHQTLHALQSQRLHDLQERAVRRAAKEEQQLHQDDQYHQAPRRQLPGVKFAKTKVWETKKEKKAHSPPQGRKMPPSIVGEDRVSSPDPVAVASTMAVASSRSVSLTSLSSQVAP